jgi:hypothetical protein
MCCARLNVFIKSTYNVRPTVLKSLIKMKKRLKARLNPISENKKLKIRVGI